MHGPSADLKDESAVAKRFGKSARLQGEPCATMPGAMLNIRKAVASDVPLILQFIHELAEYEKRVAQT